MRRRLRAVLAGLALVNLPMGAALAQTGTLKVAVTSLPPAQGNIFAANGTPSSTVWFALFDALVRIDAQGKPAPALALSWTNPTPAKWRFVLRPGVSFSNGETFDAAAVKAAIDWLISEKGAASQIGGEMRGIKAATVIDARTLDIDTKDPDPILPNRLSAVLIPAPKAWAAGVEAFARAPAGTGPFAAEPFGTTRGKLTVTARPESWRKPKIAKIEFSELPEAASRVQAIASGQIDIVGSIGPDDIQVLEPRGLAIHATPTPQIISLALINVRGGALADKRVRQALNYAVNKEAITREILGGRSKPAGQGAASMTPGYAPDVAPYPYDPEKAKALLKEAGHSALALSAEVITGSIPGDAAFYQLVAQDLAAVGVTLTLRPTLFPEWIRKYQAMSFETDAFGLSWNALPYNDAIRPMEYFSCLKRNPFFCEADLTPKIEAAQREMDGAKRLALLQALQREFHDRAPAIFLFEQWDLSAVGKRVKDYQVANRVPVWENITLPN